MALITDPDNLTQGTLTNVTDCAWTSSSGANTTLTSTGNFPGLDADMFFEVRDSPIPGNNGLYVEQGGTPTASEIICTKIDGVNPTDDTSESVNLYGKNDATADEKSVHVDTNAKGIYLLEQGNLSTDGVTGQALYSFLKEEWKSDASLIPHQFPMVAVTPEQFEFVDGWNPEDVASPEVVQTRKLIRSAGWTEIDASSVDQAQYMGVVTLGTFAEATDQAHYQLGNDPTDTSAAVDFTFAGPVNEAVQTLDYVGVDPGTGYTFGDGTGSGGNDQLTRTATNWDTLGMKGGGSVTLENCNTAGNDGTYEILVISTTTLDVAAGSFTTDSLDTTATAWVDDRSAVTVFCREPFTTSLDPDSGKTYASAALTDIGVTAVDNKAFRFPLGTVADLKVETADATIAGTSPYTQIVIKYFDGVYSRDVDTGTNRDFGIAIDVGTHSGIDGSAPGAASVLTSDDGGIPTSTYDGGTLTMLEGADEGTAFTVSSTTGTTVTVSDGPIASTSGSSFVLQRSSPIVATAEEIYEKVQWSLRQNSDIDDSAATVTGSTGEELLAFVGDTLITQEASNPNTGTADGVIIEGFDSNDTNRITFTDNAGATFTYPFVAAGSINFNSYLVDDTGPASYWMFFTYTHTVQNTGFGTSASSTNTCTLDSSTTDLTTILSENDYLNMRGYTDGDIDGVYVVTGTVLSGSCPLRRVDGEDCIDEAAGATVNVDLNPIDSPDALLVDNNAGTDITGTISSSPVAFDFDYDGNVQGGRTAAADAAITIRAIGEELAQFVETTGTITRDTGLTFSLVAGLERNFENP